MAKYDVRDPSKTDTGQDKLHDQKDAEQDAVIAGVKAMAKSLEENPQP